MLRRQCTTLFVIVEPLAGRRHVTVTERRATPDFAVQMKYLCDEMDPEVEVMRVVLDNLDTHTLGALFATFSPDEAWRLEFHDTPKHAGWLNMAECELSVPREPGVEIHLVIDNDGAHKSPAVKRWFLRHPEYHLHFTPTSNSWLNQVQRFFAEITEKRIRRGAFRRVAALGQAIRESLEDHNRNPRSIVSTADADLILGRVKAIRQRNSDSGHDHVVSDCVGNILTSLPLHHRARRASGHQGRRGRRW